MEDLELFKAQLKEEIKAEILKDQEEARSNLGFLERNPLTFAYIGAVFTSYILLKF